MENLILCREEAAKACRVSVPTLTAWMNRANDPLPHVRAGRKYLILASALDSWLRDEARRQSAGGGMVS